MSDDLQAAVALAVGGLSPLKPDGHNDHSNYDFVSAGAVAAAAREAYKLGLPPPRQIKYEIVSDSYVRMKGGGEANLVKMCCTLWWGPEDFVEGYGSGQDYNDKALLKAQTAARREAWKARLEQAGKGDPEADTATDSDRPVDNANPQPSAGKVYKLPRMKWLGDDGGKDITTRSEDVLLRFGEWKKSKLDPSDKWHSRDLELLAAIRSEIRRRRDRDGTDIDMSSAFDAATRDDDASDDDDPWGLVPPPSEP